MCEGRCDFQYNEDTNEFVCCKCGHVLTKEDKQLSLQEANALLKLDEAISNLYDFYKYHFNSNASKLLIDSICENLLQYVTTNSDYIRTMSDEELAEFNINLTNECEIDYDYEETPYEHWYSVYRTSDYETFYEYEDAFNHELWWLNQSYEEEMI